MKMIDAAMKMKLPYLLILTILLSCSTKPHEQASAVDTTATIVPSLSTRNQVQESSPLGIVALHDFEVNAAKRSVSENDSLFMEFLQNFTTYQNKLNDELYNSPDYETYNTLVWADETLVKPEARVFQDSVRGLGFFVASTEGTIFLEKDPAFLSKFSKYLSERMNAFLKEYNEEIKEPLAEDGGLIITWDELVRRMFFWEDFAKQHPGFELPEYANNQFETYLDCLMFGMDNTPIHDWTDSPHVSKEFIDLYKSIIANHPESKATKYLRDYLNFIDEKEQLYDESYFEYRKKVFPE